MDKHKINYTHTYKGIVVQLLLSVVLFANCERLDVSPNSVDPQPGQEEAQCETIVLDQQAHTGFSYRAPSLYFIIFGWKGLS